MDSEAREPTLGEALGSTFDWIKAAASGGAVIGKPGSHDGAMFGRYAPIVSRSANGGEQHVFEFPNGYGASVVRHSFSYGSGDGKYELAVLRFSAPGNWSLTYDTPITSDVLGWLSPGDVAATLERIEALK